MNAGVHCPYCDAQLAEVPSRSIGCRHCGKPILDENIPSSRPQRVRTAAQAVSVWQACHGHPHDLQTLGVVDLAERELERKKSNRVAPGDNTLAEQQRVERIAQRSADPSERKAAALQAAWGAVLAGENYSPYLCFLHWARLDEIATRAEHAGVQHVRIVASGPGGRCCAACERMDGQIMVIESESASPTLPVQGCTCTGAGPDQAGFCLCYYELVSDDEL